MFLKDILTDCLEQRQLSSYHVFDFSVNTWLPVFLSAKSDALVFFILLNVFLILLMTTGNNTALYLSNNQILPDIRLNCLL